MNDKAVGLDALQAKTHAVQQAAFGDTGGGNEYIALACLQDHFHGRGCGHVRSVELAAIKMLGSRSGYSLGRADQLHSDIALQLINLLVCCHGLQFLTKR